MARPCIVAGNWKMYKTASEAVDFVKKLAPKMTSEAVQVYLAVSFTSIKEAADAAQGTKVVVGAQNMNDVAEGAFTGEIAAGMLQEAGAQFVILGHSERRHVFHETSDFVNKKVKRALQSGLQPIVCVGETLQEREGEKTEEVLKAQLAESLAGLTGEQMGKVILAYEPVWAIGSGITATPEMAQQVHQYCRKVIAETWGEEIASQIVIQYGGSVRPSNASELFAQADIDGVLVGGASLEVESFLGIIEAKKE